MLIARDWPAGGPAPRPDGSPVSYGFGWEIDSYRGHHRVYHDGSTIGFRTTIQRFPEDGLTVVILVNRADAEPSAWALQVAGLFLKL